MNMHNSTLDILEQKADEEANTTIEQIAASLELTVDYYIAEFLSITP
jgi:hypothetical protein